MSDKSPGAMDYPIAETQPDRVVGARGRSINDLTIEMVVDGDVTMEDLRITPQALLDQASIARSVGRTMLAANFERAAEMTRVPQEEVVRVYELLRPGRAASRDVLMQAAMNLRDTYGAEKLARFVEEAADVYERRGLYRQRF
ncbi:MAG: diol dehydratase small subunit [Rhodospirillales bacterium]